MLSSFSSCNKMQLSWFLLLSFCLLFLLCPCLSVAAPENTAQTSANSSDAPSANTSEQAEQQEKQKEREASQILHDTEALERKQKNAEQLEAKKQEVAALVEDDPWKDVWSSQKVLIETAAKEAMRFSDNFISETSMLEQIKPMEEDIRRLLIMANEFNRWPAPLEAISRRLSTSASLVNSIILNAAAGQLEAKTLLERLNKSVDSLPQDIAKGGKNSEIKDYITTINKARFLLTAVITRYASALAPAKAILENVNTAQSDIAKQLPQLWKDYYLQPPVPWLTLAEWEKLANQLDFIQKGLSLRKSIEIPITANQWQASILRFFITLLAFTVLGLILINKFFKDRPELAKSLKHQSLPFNAMGIAFLSASFVAYNESYRLFLALGNLQLIIGQVSLAWNLRRYRFPEVTLEKSPIFSLLPLTFAAYVLIYFPMPRLMSLMGWIVCLVIQILILRRRKPRTLGPMQMEGAIMDLEPMILWPCLIVSLFGLHLYSMVFYLLYTSLSIATQLSVASMSFISNLNERLPKEGSKSIVASLVIALSAPVIIIMAIFVLSLWLATLPGGLHILDYYFFKSINIGATQLNIVQLLLIFTAFFLARTAARMGRTFISKLPAKGVKVEASLVTPLQTGYTYAIWGCFGLFVLRSIGLNMSSLAVIAGGLSVGIGFGMQTIVNNFISGLILIFSRTLQVGDIVEAGGVVGRIKRINVRATVVETYDSATIYVPNSEFVSGKLTNWTSNSRSCRQEVLISVAYNSDPQKVVKILTDLTHKEPDILAFPQPVVLLKDFGANTLDFRLLFWVKDYDLGAGVASKIRFAVNKKFEEEKIEFAYPQLDVHVKDLPNKKPARITQRALLQRTTPRPLRRRPLRKEPQKISS